MFFGEFSHQLDGNKRIRIPTPFKNELGATFYMAKGFDKVIKILPVKLVESEVEKLQSVSEFDEEGQDALLEYLSSVFRVDTDNQGRVKIPDELYDFADFKDCKDVITVGMGNKLSLMSKVVREEKRNKRTHQENMNILERKTQAKV